MGRLLLVVLLILIFLERWGLGVVMATGVATMEDYWQERAYFKFENRILIPTLQNDGRTGWFYLASNGGMDVEIVGGVWYLFYREMAYKSSVGSVCQGAVYTRIVLRKSTDKGKTWSQRVVLFEPTDGGEADYCANTDGDAFYDRQTNMWHYLYQCLLADKKTWAICHAYKNGSEPVGGWVKNPSNPVVRSEQLWRQICRDGNSNCRNLAISQEPYSPIGDEGTPEIVEKRSDGYFYITFHGWAPPKLGFRGVARSRDMVNWETVGNDSIFDKSVCDRWQYGGYDSFGCVGGGAGTILKEGDMYYMLVEGPDKSLAYTLGQKWNFGMMRSRWLSSGWEQLNKNPVIFSSLEKPAGKSENYGCGTQYAKLFRDSDGSIYLMYLKLLEFWDYDHQTGAAGVYLYKLTKNSPLVEYNFRESYKFEYSASDVVSRFNQEIKPNNVSWKRTGWEGELNKNNLVFNGINSFVTSVSNHVFGLSGRQVMFSIDAKIDSLPARNSAMIGGVLYSYYLELYANGNLCFWVYTANNTSEAVCVSSSNLIGKMKRYMGVFDGGVISLYVDGVRVGQKTVSGVVIYPRQSGLMLGGRNSADSGLLGSFKGEVSRVAIYDKVVSEEIGIAECIRNSGDFDGNGLININDLVGWYGVYKSNRYSKRADFNCDGKIDSLDLVIWRGSR